MNVQGAVPVDPNTAQRGASDPSASVWVMASAGTGKTKVLTDRVLSLMLTGTRPERILCLTYTKAATAEMNTRIAKQLGLWAAFPDATLEGDLFQLLGRRADDNERTRARQLFARVLDTPGGMNIQTIHAFCQSLLGRFPLEAGVAPHFSVMDEADSRELLTNAREDVLIRARTDSGLLAWALSEVTRHLHETGFTDLMASLAAERSRLERLIEIHGSIEGVIAAVRDLLGIGDDETEATITAEACDECRFDAAALRRVVVELEAGKKTDSERAAVIGGWLAASSQDRMDGFETYVRAYLTQDTGTKQFQVRKRLATKGVFESMPQAEEILLMEAERVLAAVMKRKAAATARATAALLILGDALLGAYGRLKAARALLDYNDLILHVARLLERQGNASWVLFKLDGGIDHVLIDEAQDTSPEQWRIVRALTAEFFTGAGAREGVRTVFAVGDVKQSIYSFQGAAPEQFVANQDIFGQQVRQAEEIWRPIDLTVSFRSTRAILQAVDAVFAMPGAADGLALDGQPIHHQAWRQQEGGMVELWPAVTPLETDAPQPWKPPVERIPGDSPQARLAQLIARRIKEMISGSEILESKSRPITAGDIMVLVRRRTVFVEEVVRALKLLRVPVTGVDRMVLTDQLAVMDLIAIGRFVLLPTDDLTLATVLKSPLIGLGEDHLFRLANNRDGHLWDSLRAHSSNAPEFGDALRRLSEYLSLADTMPPFEFYAKILGPLRGRKKLFSRLGREAEDPIAEFLDLALDFERTHPPTLEGFLHWLEAGKVEIKRDMEQEGTNAVRVMTVHGAKGLQAPIVFLPDTMGAPTKGSRFLWAGQTGDNDGLLLWPPSRAFYETVAERERDAVKRKDQQEYRRLLYVAMTRAEDRLIVCGWKGKKQEPDDCWYHLIKNGLEAISGETLKQGEALEENEDPFLATAPEIDTARVLRLTCPQEAAGKKLQAKPVFEHAPLPPWALAPPADEPDPPRPLAPSRPEEDEPAVRSPVGPDNGHRFKRGRLIHRLLQSLPEVAPDRRAATARSWLGRPAHGLSPETCDEMVAEVLGVLEHPEYAPLFGPGSRAEVPLTGLVEGRVVSGQVDRLLITSDSVTVLDYKTNRPVPRDPSSVSSAYLRQMAAYRAVLRLIYPNLPVHCVLLWTDGPLLMTLEDDLIDRHMP